MLPVIGRIISAVLPVFVLGSVVIHAGPARAACTLITPGNYTCSDPTTVAVGYHFNGAPVNVTIDNTFIGNGTDPFGYPLLLVDGTGGVTFDQAAGSSVTSTGGARAVYIRNNFPMGGPGDVNVAIGGSIYSDSDALIAENHGPGDVSFTQSAGSDITANVGSGVYLIANGGDTFADISGSITSTNTTYGLAFIASGTGAATVNVRAGALLSGGVTGMVVYSWDTADIIVAGEVSGNQYGISYANAGVVGDVSSSIKIAGSGSVSGQQYAILDGDLWFPYMANLAVESAGKIDGDVELSRGDDSLTLLSGSTTSGQVLMGDDSDSVFIRGNADIAGVTLFDGGDDLSSADGMVDVLAFEGWSGAVAGANLTNWESVRIGSGSTVTFSDQTLTAGLASESATGLFVDAGGTLNAVGGFTLTGNLANAGTVFMLDGTAGDETVVNGNYVGNGGSIVLNTALGNDASATDRLIINGDTSGSSLLRVVNAGGSGAQTAEGIKVIDVAGASDGVFSLIGDYTFQGAQAVVEGAYAYRLYQGGVSTPTDGDWYLRSTLDEPPGPHYQAGVPIYEAYPQALLGLNGLPTLQQRVGNRFWSSNGAGIVSEGADAGQEQAPVPEDAAALAEGRGVWGRIEASHASIDPAVATTVAEYDYDIYKLQAGLDVSLHEGDAGTLIGGLTVHYGHAAADVSSFYGNGDIATNGYGFGGTLTWYGTNGFYLDGQGQVSWYDSDLTSHSELGRLADGNDGFGYALSLEGGQRIDLNDGWMLTPQAQLVYSSVDFDAFTQMSGDVPRARVSLLDGDSLRGRLGLTLDREASWQAEDGTLSRGHIYGIGNLYYEFLDGTAVDVSGVSFRSRGDRLWGGIGLGGSYNWSDDRYSIYGEGSVNTSLNSFGDSNEVKGTTGLRVKW